MTMPACTPCPIPRCALEWFLALMAVIAGVGIGLSGDPRLGHYDIDLLFLHVPMNSLRWAVGLCLIGLVQAAAISVASQGPQRLVSGIAAFAWAAFSFSAWHGGMVAFAYGVAILTALGQLYVCAMLRGARWRR